MHAYSPSSCMLMLTGRVIEASHLEILGTGIYPNECMIEGRQCTQYSNFYRFTHERRVDGVSVFLLEAEEPFGVASALLARHIAWDEGVKGFLVW